MSAWLRCGRLCIFAPSFISNSAVFVYLMMMSLAITSAQCQIQNLRVYVYFPERLSPEINGLVVWDPSNGTAVKNFSVSIFDQSKKMIDNLSTMNTLKTHTTLEHRNNLNLVTYQLMPNTTYTATVYVDDKFAINQSASANFTTQAASPPLGVLAFTSRKVISIGEVIIASSSVNSSIPPTINTVKREIYWYSDLQGTLVRSLFNGGVGEPLFSDDGRRLFAGSKILRIAYDWIGERIYFVSSKDEQLTLWKIPLQNPNGLQNVTLLGHGSSILSFAIDPFSGFLYWSINISNIQILNLRNLSQPSATGNKGVFSTLQFPHYAFTLDPVNGDIWIARIDGDIIIYSGNTNTFKVAVNASYLSQFSNHNNTSTGLPACSIALDEDRIYWIGIGKNGVFYTSRNNATIIQTLSITSNISAILSLSPGQQPLPPVHCLSYNDTKAVASLAPDIVSTNVTALFTWMEPPLREECQNTMLDYPSFTYVIDLRQHQQPVEGLKLATPQTTTYDTQFFVSGVLIPFTEYQIRVFAYNGYTVASHSVFFFRDSGFVYSPADMSRDYTFWTKEGVPGVPQNLKALPAARKANLTWNPPSDVKGNRTRTFYYILYNSKTVISEKNYTLTGLLPGNSYAIMVLTSNGVLNSTAITILVKTWALPPLPTLLNKTNTSIVVTTNLTSFPFILNYNVKVETFDGINETQKMNVTCQSFLLSNCQSFLLSNLKAFTHFKISIVGTYQSGEKENSAALEVQTDPGVPSPPVISLRNSYLQWPNISSNDVTGIVVYRLLLYRLDAEFLNKLIDIDSIMQQNGYHTFDVRPYLSSDQTEYNLTLFARNSIGEGPGSNTIKIGPTNPPTMTTSRSPRYEAIAAGIGGALVFCFALCLCGSCFIMLLKEHNRSRERYNDREDIELAELRLDSRAQAANNPQYTWCKEDYFCTDHDLDEMGSFPRENLKIESFIDQGEFGEVYQGTAKDLLGPNTGSIQVAVKTLHKGASLDQKRKFLGEAHLMSNFNHPNILRIMGVSIDYDPIYIIMELMPGGDLLHFLREAKRETGPPLLTVQELIQLSSDVANGCSYLQQARFIHRDIAARNCLVSSKGGDRVVKIGDFGLAKDLYSSDYYQVEGQRKLPVRWMAPEALLQGKFTMETDVWSFGVLLWEVMTLGYQPYPGLTNQEVLHFVVAGGRLERPQLCPRKIYNLMNKCWKNSSFERPYFDEILEVLKECLNHLNRSSVSSGEASDEEGIIRQGSAKGETGKMALTLALQEDLDTPRYHESIHGCSNQNSNTVDSQVNLKSTPIVFDERGPV